MAGNISRSRGVVLYYTLAFTGLVWNRIQRQTKNNVLTSVVVGGSSLTCVAAFVVVRIPAI